MILPRDGQWPSPVPVWPRHQGPIRGTGPFDCKLSMPNQGDLLVDGRWLFEVGGKNKGFKQIKGIEDSFVVSDGIDIGYGKKIPLWLFGMLY